MRWYCAIGGQLCEHFENKLIDPASRIAIAVNLPIVRMRRYGPALLVY